MSSSRQKLLKRGGSRHLVKVLLFVLPVLILSAVTASYFLFTNELTAEELSATRLPLLDNIDGVKLLAATHDDTFSGASAWWYKARVGVDAMQRVKERLRQLRAESGPSSSPGQSHSAFVKSCLANVSAGSQEAPSWWQPDELSDLDAEQVGSYPFHSFLWSEKSQLIYVYFSGH